VPVGPLLRAVEPAPPFSRWGTLLLRVLPLTFFFHFHWAFGLVGGYGALAYVLVGVPLSARVHVELTRGTARGRPVSVFLWYFVVVAVGYGSLRGFVGHLVLADTVAAAIGWAPGSPFQTELAFYHLGTAVAALLGVWLRDLVALGTTAPGSTSAVLAGAVLLPTVLLVLWMLHVRP
jgi:hypothetical protein